MLSEVTAPAIQPLTWLDVKGHLRLDVEDERNFVEDVLIPAVALAAVQATNRALINTTLQLNLDAFPCGDIALELPRAPLRSVTHVKYADPTTGTMTTWPSSDYVVDVPVGPMCQPGRIWPAYGKVWPTPRCQRNAVEIVYVAGYGSSVDKVPALLKAGMLLLAGHLYENREAINVGNIVAELPLGARELFRKFHVPTYRDTHEAVA